MEKTGGRSRAYLSPEISVTFIELEEGIASGSASIRPVGQDGDFRPSEKWKEEKFTDDVSW